MDYQPTVTQFFPVLLLWHIIRPHGSSLSPAYHVAGRQYASVSEILSGVSDIHLIVNIFSNISCYSHLNITCRFAPLIVTYL